MVHKQMANLHTTLYVAYTMRSYIIIRSLLANEIFVGELAISNFVRTLYNYPLAWLGYYMNFPSLPIPRHLLNPMTASCPMDSWECVLFPFLARICGLVFGVSKNTAWGEGCTIGAMGVSIVELVQDHNYYL